MRDDARGHAAFGSIIESFVLQFPRLHVNMPGSPFHPSFVRANILVWRRMTAEQIKCPQKPVMRAADTDDTTRLASLHHRRNL